MNRKGFTLIELLATLVLLGIVTGITVFSVSGIFNNTKNKSEDAFVETIKDAMDIYLSGNNPKDSNGNKLNFTECSNKLNKTHGLVKVYKASTYFNSVINSEYRPISQGDLVNPANEEVSCKNADNIGVTIYRDDDYVYYYKIQKDAFGCLKKSGVITNLPEGFDC